MNSRFLFRAALLLSVCGFAAVAFGDAPITGNVTGADGRPSRGAVVRVQRQNGKGSPAVINADAKGQFATTNLPAGQYAVSASNGAFASVPQTVKVGSSKGATVSLRLAPAAAAAGSTAPKKKKRLVWVPAGTGSRIGGGYVEVDDNAPDSSSTRQDQATLQRLQNTQSTGRPAGGP